MVTETLKFSTQSIKTKASGSGEIQCFPTRFDNNVMLSKMMEI